MRVSRALALVALLVTAPGAVVAAQGRDGRATRPNAQRGGNLDDPGVTPAEIQRMFDSYALMQAQEQLKITDDQFPRFLPRFKVLQDVRRQGLQQRMRVLNTMRQMLNAPQPPDEAQLRDRLKELDEIETRTNTEAKKALDAIDQMLDIRQQAKFRVFEENMERRKLELVT